MKKRRVKKDLIIEALRKDSRATYKTIAATYDVSPGYVWSVARQHHLERHTAEAPIHEQSLAVLLDESIFLDDRLHGIDIDPEDIRTDALGVAVQLFAVVANGLWCDDSRFHDLIQEAPADIKIELLSTHQTTEELFELLASDSHPHVRERVARRTSNPELLDELIRDSELGVVWAAATNSHLSVNSMEAMIPERRSFAITTMISNTHVSPALATEIASLKWSPLGADKTAHDKDSWAGRVAAHYKHLTSDMVENFKSSDNHRVRIGLAGNRYEYPDKAATLEELAEDPHWQVRYEAFLNGDMPLEVRHKVLLAESNSVTKIMMLRDSFDLYTTEQKKALIEHGTLQEYIDYGIRGELKKRELPHLPAELLFEWEHLAASR